jgi:hypothetical protein
VTDRLPPEIHADGTQPKTIHVWVGRERPDEATREALCDWLRANGVDPVDVAVQPVTLEFIPGCAGSVTGCNGVSRAPWWISFTQRYRNAEGSLEVNALTGEPSQFVHTVPLRVPPPASLALAWAHEETYIQDEPLPRMLRSSEVREMHVEGGDE